MKSLLKIEELLLTLLSYILFAGLGYPWWWYLVFFLAPDLSITGYLVNPRVGAVAYNITHHKGLAVILYSLGIYFNNPNLQFIGLIIIGHSSLDRVLGYGLKYPDSFQHTHLGMIGRAAAK